MNPTWSQNLPQAINFQGVARGDNSKLIRNKVIGLRLTIIDRADGGKEIYREKQSDTTDAYGFFSLQIGRPLSVDKLPNSVDFKDIPWQTGDKFLQIEFDTTAGQTFPIKLGTLEMVTVPFAFAAASVTNINDQNAKKGDVLVFDGTNWVPGQAEVPVVRTTINYMVNQNDGLVEVNAKNNDVTITIPKANVYNRILRIRVFDASNNVTIKNQDKLPFALSNGDTSHIISLASGGDYLEMYSNGTQWILSKREIRVFVDALGSSNQTINTSTSTDILWDIEYEDNHEALDKSFMVPKGCSGTYIFNAFVEVSNPNGIDWDESEYLDFRLRVNNESSAKVIGRDRMGTSNDSRSRGARSTSGSRIIFLHEGDEVEMEAYQNIGGNLVIDFATLYITRIGS